MIPNIFSKRIVIPVLIIMAISLAACSTATPSDGDSTEGAPEPLKASGFIEAEEVSVVSEVGGLVDQVLADEGDTVKAGQTIVVLNDALLRADRAEAQAAVAIAEANLADLKAGATEEELEAAQAAIDEAQSRIDGTERSSGQAWGAAGDPQGVDVQLTSARTEADMAQRQLELLQVQLKEAEIVYDWLSNWADPSDPIAIEFKGYEVEMLRANVRAAEIRYQGALDKITLLEKQQERPLSAIAQARSISSQIPIYEHQLELAQAQYELLKNGPLPEEIAIVEAQVNLAKAGVTLIDAQIARLTLIAPIDGVVTTRAIHVGETATPGSSLLTISNLNELKLVVYIPEDQIGQVQLGQSVDLTVDAYPNETFSGEVNFIAREAEFTPRNVQTEEERVNLVFAVEIKIDNEEGKLKPGMPADVVIEAKN
jgi:HlyD family secretion protein